MDIVEIYDADHSLVYTGGYDRNAPSPESKNYDWHFTDIVEFSFVDTFDKNDKVYSGIAETPDGLIMFAVRPVLKSNGDGPSVGVFFFGRFLDDSLIRDIQDKTKVDVKLIDLDAARDTLGPRHCSGWPKGRRRGYSRMQEVIDLSLSGRFGIIVKRRSER
jgi:sensor domain CHASE-containing protein